MSKINIKKIPLIKFFEKMTFQALERWLLMSKILKKFTEGNGQNLQFIFIIFFCFDVIKFLKPVFHTWSPAHFVDNNQNSEKCCSAEKIIRLGRLKVACLK